MRPKIDDSVFLAALTEEWKTADDVADKVGCHPDTARRKLADLARAGKCGHEWSEVGQSGRGRYCNWYRAVSRMDV